MDTFKGSNIVDLGQFRKQKEVVEQEPLFTEPTVVTLGPPDDETLLVKYLVLVSIAHDGKQYLALEELGNKEKQGEIILVEAIVAENQLAGVQMVQTEEEYEFLLEAVGRALGATVETTEEEGEDDAEDN